MKAAQIVDLKRRWREQQDDVLFPDEVTVHSSSACRQLSLLLSVLCLYAPRCTTLDARSILCIAMPHHTLLYRWTRQQT